MGADDMAKIRFESDERIAIARMLDGEPIKRILPRLTGRETASEILALLKAKREG